MKNFKTIQSYHSIPKLEH